MRVNIACENCGATFIPEDKETECPSCGHPFETDDEDYDGA